jgi:hypothetical protein
MLPFRIFAFFLQLCAFFVRKCVENISHGSAVKKIFFFFLQLNHGSAVIVVNIFFYVSKFAFLIKKIKVMR